ncbi:chromosome segregation protein SMC [Thalassotalea sp. G2M2-11]|uniref:chromosome segregation protein SMC n=1 Tax=Thalassotalea sp. G2M2-11 TaxID=2787627 RepID=UPI0019D18A50|nr:chromosome segregation protein SMC [Thalassotalea sp. G2M2-11]
MRLKHIKLAGFKSFVDPTKVPFEHQMTAIVGPNGCGKSNIIDAVRWVLGESSAKNLRGDAMTDVIFNGASTRKSVGQASVELLFDNATEHITGSMADRNQVSIRRVVNRDSQNTYYLNGTKCRRKDITDIFLGTGLGPRSYAIIEQGTISRLIESKPQELRVFIEEAAGISKYKERRRDTENKIRHTRENLARLTDIRFELSQQIDKLHQQAEAAKRFRTLKKQERQFKAELAVLRWQKFDQQHKKHQQDILALQRKIEQQQSEQATNELELINAKQQGVLLNDGIQQLQQQKIDLTNKVARLEQQLQHAKQHQAKLQQDKYQYTEQLNQAQQALLSEQQYIQTLSVKQEHQSAEFVRLKQQIQEVQLQLEQANEQLNLQQQAWYQAQRHKEQQRQIRQNWLDKQTQLQAQQKHIHARLAQLKEQQTSLQQQSQRHSEQSDGHPELQDEFLVEQIAQLSQDLDENAAQIAELEQQLKQAIIQQSETRGSEQALAKQVEYLQGKLTAKSDWQAQQQQWLAENGYRNHPTVQESVSVATGWELAAEMVLASQLKAVSMTELPFALLANNELPESLMLLAEQTPDKAIASEQILSGSLAEKVHATPILNIELNRIQTANNLAEALAILPSLTAEQSVICPQGFWLSQRFVRYGIAEQKNDHLVQQRELSELITSQQELRQKNAENEEKISVYQQQITLLTTQQQERTAQLKQKQQLLSQRVQEQQLAQQSKQLVEQQLSSITKEQQQLHDQLQALEQSLAQVVQELSSLANSSTEKNAVESENDKQTLSDIEPLIEQLQQDVKRSQSQHHTLVQEKHQVELALEKTKHQYQQASQTIVRLQESIAQLTEQQAKHGEMLQDNIAPIADDEQQLAIWLEQMSTLELQLVDKQQGAKQAQQQVNDIEQTQRSAVESTNQLTQQLNQISLDAESSRLKAESAVEQLQELGQSRQMIVQQMPAHARESQWQAQIIKLGKDIQSLGAINLAAIDEFETQLNRKNYLDQQDQDLNLAISTLESAIEKIDKESRQKFKLTFDKVNQDLQSLFPKVFGGGSAYLSLTGDDLLETGITIMARPPGKKNSTIHLLSGGEKALTALSLVFAIFRLNPAPFCMLDEVDAPLDDANVGRFCNLVKEMSQTVQFIYISHNKIAMEMATHLTGVTMFEAGVSRMVTVDIDEAIAMAEVS